jgi:hypothetical protein
MPTADTNDLRTDNLAVDAVVREVNCCMFTVALLSLGLCYYKPWRVSPEPTPVIRKAIREPCRMQTTSSRVPEPAKDRIQGRQDNKISPSWYSGIPPHLNSRPAGALS